MPGSSDSAERDSAIAWARAELRRLGHRVAGEADAFRVRPWSTIFRIPTDRGNVYLKAVPSRLRHEVRLTRWLAARYPDRVLQVLAADDERGLLLLPDGGTRLRDAGIDTAGWARLVRDYAELQVSAAGDVDAVLSLGVPDRRLASLPAALAQVMPGDAAALALYRSLCERLAALGVPETIQMDDLHDGNVFVDAGAYRLFDWGDASVTHPFVSLPMVLTTVARRAGVARDDVSVARVRDAYLAAFSGIASFGSLREAAVLAERVMPTVRILSWKLALEGVPAEELATGWGESLEELVEQQRSALVA